MPVTLPLRHLSIRVPWHDDAWKGTICPKAADNAACLCLEAIRDNRDDNWESDHAGQHIADLKDRVPPCVRERATFMSARPITLSLTHRLTHDKKWAHIQPTDLELPKYSAPALPFRWVSRDGAEELAAAYGTGYDPSVEPMEDWMADGSWVLNPYNQKLCLDAFWSAIQPQRSLVFFYAKAVPGIEDHRRVLIGVGRVIEVLPPRQFRKGDPNGYEAWVWERAVRHSIKPEFIEGFVLPYHALLKKAAGDPALQFSDFVAFTPEDHHVEFSYVTEHVTADGALHALESCRGALERIKGVVPGPWDKVLGWINDRMTEVVRQRGPFPGIGAALTAFGMPQGVVFAAAVNRDLPDGEDPWPRVIKAFGDPHSIALEFRSHLTSALQKKFTSLRAPGKAARWEFLRLLSRFALSTDQAKLLWKEREAAHMETRDEDFLKNPYAVFQEMRHPVVMQREITTAKKDGTETSKTVAEIIPPVSFWTIDRGVFLPKALSDVHPLWKEGVMQGACDIRRVRALLIHILHRAEAEGHSLLPRHMLVQRAAAMAVEPPCPVDEDLIEAFESDLEDHVVFVDFGDDTRGCQLLERATLCDRIRDLLGRNKRGSLPSTVNWRARLETQLKKPAADKRDELARTEKTEALQVLAGSRFSLLIGPAGTGKTTLLAALCSDPSIRDAGVLLLAPTGKARVRLQSKVKGLPAQTIAQYLISSGRYESETGRYLLPQASNRELRYKTIIVDEASMLTEDQLGTLAEEVFLADRIILAGDPGQLPPIGVGRPFVDLVTALRPVAGKMGAGYAELTQQMRQTDGEDLQLAELFSGRPGRAGDDQIIFDLTSNPNRSRVRCVEWNSTDDLRTKISTVIGEELGTDANSEALAGTLGGTADEKGRWFFNRGCEEKVESWQVLAPMRYVAGGTDEINRTLQRIIRGTMLAYAASRQKKAFRVSKPMGAQQIVYGDKVINVVNRRNRYVWPKDGAAEFVANGEIGTVIGETFHNADTKKWLPDKIHITFGSQPGYTYSFLAGAFREEGEAEIELAYAITIHKAQGSEFKKTFVVLPAGGAIACRELLYTALTRHQEKLVVFHQGDLGGLLSLAAVDASETAQRITCINISDPDTARRPAPVKVTSAQSGRPKYLERLLVHRTRNGTLVQSKSEVIIAAELDFARERSGLRYVYEQPLPDRNGGRARLPDFTIYDEVGGRVYYWEHCGMLSDDEYSRKWRAKEQWYAEHGITRWHPDTAPNGSLIVTEDTPQGHIDAELVKKIVERIVKR